MDSDKPKLRIDTVGQRLFDRDRDRDRYRDRDRDKDRGSERDRDSEVVTMASSLFKIDVT